MGELGRAPHLADLRARRCKPCEGGIAKLQPDEIAQLVAAVPHWRVEDDRLLRSIQFADFAKAIAFVNRIAAVAEAEGHHPDFCVHYRRVDLTLSTHAIGGLSENDFILAAKIDAEV
jgi:4a-hydroxytetrahydrobiopterin dehydratase